MQKFSVVVFSLLLFGCSINVSSSVEGINQTTESTVGTDTSIHATTCGVGKGDSIAMTKQFYGVSDDPLPFHKPSRLPGNNLPGSYYRFTDIGVRVFFDPQGVVDTVRYDAPFSGSLDGISIGVKRDAMIASKGQPDREFEGMLSMDKNELDEKIQGIVNSTPEPISKDDLRSVLAQIDALKKKYATVRNRAYVYRGDNRFVRYDVNPVTDRVQTILTDYCSRQGGHLGVRIE